MENSRGMELKNINLINSFLNIKGLIYCLNENLTPNNSHYVVRMPTNIDSFFAVTFAMVFTAGTASSCDLLNNNSGFGESPRIRYSAEGNSGFYYAGSGFDSGVFSGNGFIFDRNKNIVVCRANSQTVEIDAWVNKIRLPNKYRNGTPPSIDFNQEYRLSGLTGTSNFPFNGTYNFFGIWNRALTDREVNILNKVL